MKPGKEYEEFVYDKFRKFYKDFKVTFDDKIIGLESGINRQIDVSIKGTLGDVSLLYVVQCKDYKRPVDIIVIGEFSSVIKDVGASKGFLICAAGFAKTIHDYARKLGIELLSVEDINSSKWRARVEIPIVYIKDTIDFDIYIEIFNNANLIERNRDPIQVSEKDLSEVSLNEGQSSVSTMDYIQNEMRTRNVNLLVTNRLDLTDPVLVIKFADIWCHVGKFEIIFETSKARYLKYVSPTEYSHIKDHLRKSTVPLSLSIKDLSMGFDEDYTKIEDEDIPVFTGLNLEIEVTPESIKGRKVNLIIL